MGKSKSHPCRHPESAWRGSLTAGAFLCKKCKQRIMLTTMKPAPKSEIPEPVRIMEGSPRVDVDSSLQDLENEGGIVK